MTWNWVFIGVTKSGGLKYKSMSIMVVLRETPTKTYSVELCVEGGEEVGSIIGYISQLTGTEWHARVLETGGSIGSRWIQPGTRLEEAVDFVISRYMLVDGRDPQLAAMAADFDSFLEGL